MADSKRDVLIDRSMKQVFLFFGLFIMGGYLIHHLLDSWEIRCQRAVDINCECLARKYGKGLAAHESIRNVFALDLRSEGERADALILDREGGRSVLPVPRHLNFTHQLDEVAQQLGTFMGDPDQSDFKKVLAYPQWVQILTWCILVVLLLLFLIALWGKTIIIDRGRNLLTVKGGFSRTRKWALTDVANLTQEQGDLYLQQRNGHKVRLRGLTPKLQKVMLDRMVLV